MDLRVLITGGCGFIGSALIRHLMKQTGHRVLNVDKLTYAGNPESLAEVSQNSRYEFAQVDVCDRKAMEVLFDRYRPDAIIHLAAESHVDRSIDAPGSFVQTNVVGTYELLEASRAYYGRLEGGKKDRFRFQHVSTDEVYGTLQEDGSLFSEETPYAPSSPYSASKAASDHFVRAWGKTFDLPILITNCSNNYGPFQFPEKLIPHMILNALAGKPLPVYGEGRQIRDWLYVDDHAEALSQVLENGRIGETYNIGGKQERRNLEVVQLICELLEELARARKPEGLSRYQDLITFVKDRPGHDLRYAIDTSKIEKEIGWSPREDFESGLRKTLRWYLENEPWWKNVLSGSYRMDRLGKPVTT